MTIIIMIVIIIIMIKTIIQSINTSSEKSCINLKYEETFNTYNKHFLLKFQYPRSAEVNCFVQEKVNSPPLYMWFDGRLKVYSNQDDNLDVTHDRVSITKRRLFKYIENFATKK